MYATVSPRNIFIHTDAEWCHRTMDARSIGTEFSLTLTTPENNSMLNFSTFQSGSLVFLFCTEFSLALTTPFNLQHPWFNNITVRSISFPYLITTSLLLTWFNNNLVSIQSCHYMIYVGNLILLFRKKRTKDLSASISLVFLPFGLWELVKVVLLDFPKCLFFVNKYLMHYQWSTFLESCK